MKRTTIMMQTIAVTAAVFCCTVATAESATIKVKIQNIDGKPAEGVKIFLYDSTNVRKPADFISAPSEKNGTVVATVPTGKYWAVARLKKGTLYGPLMPGDKHSGDPVEIDCSDGPATEVSFVVADIREVGQKKRTNNADTIKVWGRVVDKEGTPIENAYVFAHSTKEIEYIPEYLSTWTDEHGNYTLHLPSGGSFFVGSATLFPPPSKPSMLKEFAPEPGGLDVATDIQLIVY